MLNIPYILLQSYKSFLVYMVITNIQRYMHENSISYY